MCVNDDVRINKILYNVGKFVWIIFLFCGIYLTYFYYDQHNGFIKCIYKSITGLPCPGCGLTRAVYYLFKGDIITSIKNNIGVVYFVVVYAHYMTLYFYRLHFTHEINERPIKYEYYVYGFAIVIITQWIGKIVWLIYCK